MYTYEAKVFLGDNQWILCISSISHHFLLVLLNACACTCMPHLGQYRKSTQSLTNRINLSAFGHEAPDVTFISTQQFYPSFFQLQQIHISSWRKTARPATSKVILPKQMWNSFMFIQFQLKWSQSASKELQRTVHEKCSSLTSSSVMSIRLRRKQCVPVYHTVSGKRWDGKQL